VEFTDEYWDKDSRPKPENCRSFRIDPASLVPGVNRLAVASRTDHEIEIERIGL